MPKPAGLLPILRRTLSPLLLRRRREIIATVVFLVLSAAGYAVFQRAASLAPHGEYWTEADPERRAFSLPLDLGNQPEGILSIDLTITVHALHPRQFTIIPDDCLESLTVNGETVADSSIPFCDYAKGRTFDLAGYLQTGENLLHAEVKNNGGNAGIKVQVPRTDPLPVAASVLFLVVLTLYVSFLFWPRARKQHTLWWIIGTFIAGSAIRIFYVLATPYWVRNHDVDGHIEYIRYIVEHWALPEAHGGWQFYQPPLYYVLSAFAQLLGSPLHGALPDLAEVRTLSVLLSIGTLAVGISTGMLLFWRSSRLAAVLFGLVFAFFPGLVFVAARINNDVLYTFLGFVSLALLVRWWKTGATRDWYLLCISVALGMLTKSNAVLLAPIIFLCLLLRRGSSWTAFFHRFNASLLLIVALTGWFLLPRTFGEEHARRVIVGNIDNLNSALVVPNSLSALTTFNPVAIVRIPYNNPWRDEARRANFWEYLLRSAFFGEFEFGESRLVVARTILTTALFLLLFSLVSLWRSLRRRLLTDLPLLVSLAILLAGHFLFRLSFPASPSQDFRYSVLLVLPVTFFVVAGLRDDPRILRVSRLLLLLLHIGSSAAFLASIYLFEL